MKISPSATSYFINVRLLSLLLKCAWFRGVLDGVKYHQYVWMKYLVLRGNHPIFRKRAFGEIKWYKYKQRETQFDYKSVVIKNFTFLDKKALTKHLAEAEDAEREEGPLDKQGTDMEFHPT